jgi:hypothetical protein
MKAVACVLVLGILALGQGCSSDTVDSKDVSESPIYRSYNLDYDVAQNSLNIMAQFRVGGVSGTTVRLSEPSSVSVEGVTLPIKDAEQSMARSLFTGTYYSLKKDIVRPNRDYSFKWMRRDGARIEDIVPVASAVHITTPTAGVAVDKNTPLDVIVDTDSQGSDDLITVVLKKVGASRSENSRDSVIKNTSKGRVIHFTTYDLRLLGAGPATLTVKHQINSVIAKTEQSIGGIVSSSYTSAPILIEISE